MELRYGRPLFNPEIDGLKVKWFSAWHPMLDEALAVLPEMETCPHELFGEIMRNPSPTAKRMGIVTDGGGPLGVVGLRRRRGCWEPAGQGVTPMAFVPCQPGAEYRVLAATRLALRVNYWPGEVPRERWVRDVHPYAVYTMPTNRKLEEHWRTSHQWRVMRTARQRTAGMKFAVESGGTSLGQVVQLWARKWAAHPDQETLRAPDIALAGEYYQRHGAYITATLRKDGELTAGTTCFLWKGTLITQTHWTSPQYRWHGSGTRVLELLYRWAQDRGLRCIDLGGGGGYKRDVGIPQGWRTNFQIVPPLHYAVLRTGRRIRQLPVLGQCSLPGRASAR
jgi:hypothetical protein